MAGYDGNFGAKRAREARAALGLGPEEPFACVLTAIEGAGVPVVVAGLPGKVAGCCVKSGGNSLLFVNGLEYVGRQRFTLAHEYGHHVMGHEGMPPDSTETVVQLFARSPMEVQANAFAAEFLAPAAGVKAMVDGEPTLETLARIAERFGVSMESALWRVNNLGLTRRDAELLVELRTPEIRQWVPFTERADELARIERRLPRVSPLLEGTTLDAALRGDASADPALSRALSLLMR